MKNMSGRYALVQFCPVPERLEFLNIGVVLLVPELGYVGVRLSKGQARVERLFGKQSKPYFEAVKAGFAERIRSELQRNMSEQFASEFASKRANSMRLSQLMPVLVSNPDDILNSLFDELVGEESAAARVPRIRRRLKEKFAKTGVVHLLDRPAAIRLPEYDLEVSVPFGYQNGCYNLIDGMRLSENAGDSLREAGKRALEGSLIWKHFEREDARKRLVVVGDFSKQSQKFYQAVSEQMEESHVKLYRLDDLNPLVSDIRENAVLHS